MMKIVCVAVVGKANNPLYIKTFDPTVEGLKFHYIVHTSLDIVEEKVLPANGGKKSTDLYLGMLCPTEDYKVYGYITTTKNKLVVVVDDLDVKEHEIKLFFKSFHAIFADAICNPFYTPDEPITSKKFDNQVISLVRTKSPESLVAPDANFSKYLDLDNNDSRFLSTPPTTAIEEVVH